MNDIDHIYSNNFGVAFQWRRGTAKHYKKVQVVFRDTGLLLSKEELVQFSKNIKCTKGESGLCGQCTQDEGCRALLLDTPAPQITLAVSYKELQAIQDLIEGTLFQINLDNYLGDIVGS
ncbi:hypothetical protein GGR42_001851 [Saonia flava]|uniref:Uncharacterized protein n=1 Tax=Saonia flava TaxID=523696 RepID=A0A846R3J4_9FLAO|nr:hypothetical protein [Saonia flava]NJB71389.1 hypothetical protein [Saonia flava]